MGFRLIICVLFVSSVTVAQVYHGQRRYERKPSYVPKTPYMPPKKSHVEPDPYLKPKAYVEPDPYLKPKAYVEPDPFSKPKTYEPTKKSYVEPDPFSKPKTYELPKKKAYVEPSVKPKLYAPNSDFKPSNYRRTKPLVANVPKKPSYNEPDPIYAPEKPQTKASIPRLPIREPVLFPQEPHFDPILDRRFPEIEQRRLLELDLTPRRLSEISQRRLSEIDITQTRVPEIEQRRSSTFSDSWRDGGFVDPLPIDRRTSLLEDTGPILDNTRLSNRRLPTDNLSPRLQDRIRGRILSSGSGSARDPWNFEQRRVL